MITKTIRIVKLRDFSEIRENLAYWLSKTPGKRIAAVEYLRKAYHGCPAVPQRDHMEPYVTADSLAVSARAWLEQIDGVNQHVMHLRPDRAALLVIDMQTYFLDPASPGGPPFMVG